MLNNSQVNFRKLVKDLADMYSDHPFDVVITELVANALDAKAKIIEVEWDNNSKILIVADNGKGMDNAQFKEYHNFAAELKTRGSSIGFAGVGAKISFNIADQVITETRHNDSNNSSNWRWHSDGSLKWKRISLNKLSTHGTRIEVHFKDGKVPSNVDEKYLISVLKHHYFPLFITEFVRGYSAISLYPTCPQFKINGTSVPQNNLSTIAALINCNNFKTQSGWGAIGISEYNLPIENNEYGVLLCTHGKVIKPELFGQSTGLLGTKLFGIVEIPSLVKYLTTNKSDIKGGRSRKLNQLLDPVREELKKFLAKHGIAVVQPNRNQLSTKLERELTKMVHRLPELKDFDGLLRKSRTLRKSDNGNIPTSEINSPSESNTNVSNAKDDSGGSARKQDEKGKTKAKRQRSRRNQGPRVAFEEHPGRDETAWLQSDTVIINSGHAAYRQRTTQDQARLTYCMFSIGIALDKANLIQPTTGNTSYVDKFIAAWGQE